LALTVREQIPDMKSVLSVLTGRRVTSMRRIGSGRNSQVYKATFGSDPPCAAKIYFRHRLDDRNRMQVEFTSLQFLWTNGFRCVPQPFAMDTERGCAVYEYIDGTRIDSQRVSNDDIVEAATFLIRLAACRDKENGRGLPPASEACFSIRDITGVVEGRLARLLAVPHDRPGTEALRRYLKADFIPAFETIKNRGQERLSQLAMSPASTVPVEERVLSPSDFGFHNALRRHSGDIVFLDFEYFGWDDPAKMVSDFLLHPAMELRPELKALFFTTMVESFKEHRRLSRRIEIVYPFIGLNWCLILLNEFVPEYLERRTFAGRSLDVARLLDEQLSKSLRMLNHVRSAYETFPYRS